MGLQIDPKVYLNKKLLAKPIYGYGWSSRNEMLQYIPEQFYFTLESLFSKEGETNGGLGLIKEPDHEFNNYYIVFGLRHYGDFNFTDKPADYVVYIVKDYPKEKNIYCSMPAFSIAAGFCEITLPFGTDIL